jgi:hypothetical protein
MLALLTERRERAGVVTPTARGGHLGSQERPAMGDTRYPYRKPTQVGWLSKLRWTSDPGLRNSAICPRTFGRRGAPGGELSSRGSGWERHKRGSGDWITEPQVPAEGVSRRIGADACPVLEG